MNDENPSVEQATRVCRHCSVQSITPGGFCPSCGKPYAGSGSNRKWIKITAIAAAVLLLAAAVVGGLAVKSSHDKQVRADQAAAVTLKAKEARVAAQKESDNAERKQRKTLITELEKNMTKSAKKVAKSGLIDGPIKYTSCTATGGGSVDDLTALTGTFNCLAVNKDNKDGTSSGYGYSGTIDWKTGEQTWQIGG